MHNIFYWFSNCYFKTSMRYFTVSFTRLSSRTCTQYIPHIHLYKFEILKNDIENVYFFLPFFQNRPIFGFSPFLSTEFFVKCNSGIKLILFSLAFKWWCYCIFDSLMRIQLYIGRFFKEISKGLLYNNHFERKWKDILSLGGFAAMVQGYCTEQLSIIFLRDFKRFIVQQSFREKE